jgi:hypothetical protein
LIWTLPGDAHTVPPPAPPHDCPAGSAEATGATTIAAAATPAVKAAVINVSFIVISP